MNLQSVSPLIKEAPHTHSGKPRPCFDFYKRNFVFQTEGILTPRQKVVIRLFSLKRKWFLCNLQILSFSSNVTSIFTYITVSNIQLWPTPNGSRHLCQPLQIHSSCAEGHLKDSRRMRFCCCLLCIKHKQPFNALLVMVRWVYNWVRGYYKFKFPSVP